MKRRSAVARRTVVSDRYEILSTLGAGSAAEVFRARDRLFKRVVALKRFKIRAGEELKRTLASEFVLLAGLHHPVLPRVYDFAVDASGRPFFTMDYLAGSSLENLLTRSRGARGTDPLLIVARYAGKILSALSYIHARGVVHGDIKPSNILFARKPQGAPAARDLRLVDFGLSFALDSIASARGTPRYMAPEVVRGAPPDTQSDLFSLGAVLRACLDARRGGARDASPFASHLESFVSRLVEPSKSLRYRRTEEAFGDFAAILETRDAAAARDVRKTFSFALRPRCWEPGEARLRERIAETRMGAGGVIIADGLRGEPARRMLNELAARARASRMRVDLGLVSGDGAGRDIRRVLAGMLAGASRSAGNDLPASALALRLDAAGREGEGALWLIEWDAPVVGSSLETLAHLSLALRSSPALVIVASPSIVEDSERRSLPPRDVAVFRSLDGGDVDLVLGDLFGEIQPRVSLARVLHDAADGDAAELERALEAAVASGALTRSKGGWIGEPARLRRAVRRAAMRSRSAAVVPPPLASAARELAILGLEFDARAAEVALGLDATATSAILSGLRLGGCITEVPAGPGDARWRFAIPGLSDSLVAKMAASRRRLLHRRVLAHFQALKGASRDPVALATHLAGSGDPASSAGIHRELGNRAFNDHDFLRACEHLEQAFLFLDGARGDGAGVVRFELAKALQSAGRSEASRSHLQQLIDERGSGVDAVDLRIAQAWNLNELGRPDDALALIQEALGLVSEGDRTRRGLLHEQMGWIEYVRRDFASAERHVDAAREAAGTEAAPRVLARIESLRGRLLGERGESLEAEKSLLRAAEMFRLLGDGWRLQTELHTLGLTLKRTDPERAREFLIRARDECARVGDDRGLVVALCNLANVDLALGAWDAAAAAYRLAIDIGESLSVASLDHPYASFGYLLTDQGRFDEALTCFDRASHIAASRRSVRVLPTIEVRRARLEMRRGHPELALKVLDGIAPSISPSERNDWVLLHLYRARALAELGRFADAELSANAATSAATTHGDETLRGEALLHCAVVDRLGGRRDVALKKLEAALAIFRHNRQRPYEARALLERAETLAPEGARVKEALADVEWAIANFERTGAAPFLERATKLRARLVRDSERRKEAPRELETLYRVGRLLEVGVDLPSLLEDLLDAAISLVGAERGMIFLVPAEGSNELVRAASRALDESEARDVERTSRGILKRALTDDSPLLSPDAKEDSRLRSLKSVIRFEIRSVLCAPLRTAKSVLGTIYLDHRIPARFGEKEAEFIRALAGLAAPAIAAAAARRSLDTEVRGLRQEVQSLRTRDGDGMAPEVIVGASASMRRVRDLVERCAASDANVLILGDTGTGKDLVAKAIHRASPRAGKPFVAVGGADLQGDMSNADLFGAVEGAATGVHARPGKFEIASGGTLYFHATESLPLDTQARLLRVLEEPYVERIGGTTKIPIDVRFLCATSADLNALVEAGAFRRDLYFRLNVVSIEIPPLRERREDIEPILRHFLSQASRERGVRVLDVSSRTLATWQAYSWPGNVRQLRALLERAVVLGCTELPPADELMSGAAGDLGADLVETSSGRSESLAAWSSLYVQRVLERCGGQKKLACKILRINYRTLQRHLGMADGKARSAP